MRRILPVLAIFAGLLSHPAWAQDKSGCDDLFRQKIENVNLLSSALVPAQGDLPAYCRVLGVVRPAINFEVRFPASNWNGKFYMAGCGGFCGTLDSDRPGFVNAINFGLRHRRELNKRERWALEHRPVANESSADETDPLHTPEALRQTLAAR